MEVIGISNNAQHWLLFFSKVIIMTIDVIRNSVFNGKTQLIEGYKLKWPISFYWKSHTVSLIGRRINIVLVECDLHNG